eukprot:SAG31_NODE_7234_length_1748_cov_1.669497_1_plen_29_part_10
MKLYTTQSNVVQKMEVGLEVGALPEVEVS